MATQLRSKYMQDAKSLQKLKAARAARTTTVIDTSFVEADPFAGSVAAAVGPLYDAVRAVSLSDAVGAAVAVELNRE